MFGSIGMPELMIIFVIALIIFGPRKLPELGRSMGKSLSEFKRASNDLKNTLDEEIRIEDKQPPSQSTQLKPPAPAAAPDEEIRIEDKQPPSQSTQLKPPAPAAAPDEEIRIEDKQPPSQSTQLKPPAPAAAPEPEHTPENS